MRAGDRPVSDGDDDAAAVSGPLLNVTPTVTYAVITRLVRNCALEGVIQYSRDASEIRRNRGVLEAPPARGMTSGARTRHQFCTRTPSIPTVDTVLFPGKFESSQSRRSVPLSQTLRFIL
jgi:hypothetical protein